MQTSPLFTGYRYGVTLVGPGKDSTPENISMRWKVVIGLYLPLARFKELVSLTDEEAEQFRNYVPTIPNDWYSAVLIEQIAGVESLVCEHHIYATPELNKVVTKAMNQLSEVFADRLQKDIGGEQTG